MKILIDKQKNYYDINSEYNDEIEGIVEKILGTEDEEPIGYQLSNKLNFFNKRYDSINRNGKRIINIESKPYVKRLNKINLIKDDLGQLETKLLEKVFTSPFHSILLTGALGSGKTALLKYIDKYIKKNLNCEYCQENNLDCIANRFFSVYINFNDKVYGKTLSEIKDKFYLKIYNNFLDHAMYVLKHEQITNQFYYDLLNNDGRLKDFSDFKLHIENTDPLIGASDDNDKKRLVFLNWIKSLKEENRSTYLSYFIGYLGKKYPSSRNGCHLLIFDNIVYPPKQSVHKQKKLKESEKY